LIFDELTDKNKLAPFYGPQCMYRLKIHSTRITIQQLSSCWDGRPFGHNGYGPKSEGWLLCPFPWG